MSRATTLAPRELPADVFDALELSAEAAGGIGAGWFGYLAPFASGLPRRRASQAEIGRGQAEPCCIYGHACFLDGATEAFVLTAGRPVLNALRRIGIGPIDNDEAVRAINMRNGITIPGAPMFGEYNSPVSFAEWCAELNVVRGEG